MMIPVNEPWIGEREKELLGECIDSGWISSEGPFVARFEQAMAQRVGRKHGVAVCNGSAALDIAVAALGIGKGEEVIMPAFTIISCAAAVVRSGAVPVLVDCDPRTWNMDVSQIADRITSKTRAIMAVHIYGLPVDMDEVLLLAQRHGIKVIEDAAETIGQTYRGRLCGSLGDISILSFYPNKHVTTGEGGMVLTDDAALAERSRSLRNLCFQANRRFVHEELGWNYRMTNLQAALGIAQLERLEESIAKKKEMGKIYNGLLSGLVPCRLPLPKSEFAENIYWVYGMVLKDYLKMDAGEAIERLKNAGVGARPFFWPMHEQPVFRRMGLFENERYPNAERVARRGFYIPSGLALTQDQMEKVARAVHEVIR